MFPDNVLRIIFQYLSVSEQLQVSLVCRKWHTISLERLIPKRKHVLDSLHVLVGTPDDTTNNCVSKIQSQFPKTPVKVLPVVNFDEVSYMAPLFTLTSFPGVANQGKSAAYIIQSHR